MICEQILGKAQDDEFAGKKIGQHYKQTKNKETDDFFSVFFQHIGIPPSSKNYVMKQ